MKALLVGAVIGLAFGGLFVVGFLRADAVPPSPTWVTKAEAKATPKGETRRHFIRRTGPDLYVLWNGDWSRDYTRSDGWTTTRVQYDHQWRVLRVFWIACDPYGGIEHPTDCTKERVL
jgi:hypothetical protein